MPTDTSRRAIQVRLRDAVFKELNQLDLPDDGRHLARVARALVHLAAQLLMSALPPVLAYHVILRTAAKAIRKDCSMPNIGVVEPLPPARA